MQIPKKKSRSLKFVSVFEPCIKSLHFSDTINGKLSTHDTGETDSSEDEDNNNFNNPHNMLCPPEMTRIFKNEPIDPIEQDQKRIRFT